jgi:anaerobic selenocysteine-containing dehydrogenase
VSQWVYERIASGKAGRPRLYMTYCWNGAYTCGDNARTREILMNEEYFPFIVAVDTSMGELSAMADLILPDATYLERWTAEAPQSYALIPFLQLRQPVTPPLGEATDMQDIFIQLARRIGGDPARLHPYDTAGDYVRACFEKTAVKARAAGKPLLGEDGTPIQGDEWKYLLRNGIALQGKEPKYHVHEKRLSAKKLAGTVVDEETGVVWAPSKAHVSAEDAKKKGYRATKKAYTGYVGQVVEGTAYQGFKPDKLNKSGLVEVRSQYLGEAAEAVWGDIGAVIRDDEVFVHEHLRSGMPSWVPVPEHRRRQPDQLYLVSFKVNVQIHSRSQNCKWLQEIYHKNPLWLHPDTARQLLGPDVEEGTLVRIEQSMPKLPGSEDRELTQADSITARVHLTQGIHPSVVALSFHCGHWEYGRYASGKALDPALTGARQTGTDIWWQKDADPGSVGDPTQWSDIRGTHPNWIIPNTPARVSGQYRSNDTLVRLSLV